MGSLSSYGQSDKIFDGAKKRVGLSIGYGNALFLERTYEYDVTLIQFQYFRSLASNKDFGIDLLVQPQLNRLKHRFLYTWPVTSTGIEFGVNLGVVFRANLFDDLISVFGAASIGPHFLSTAPLRQANGFIFSDNVFAGLNIKLKQNFYLDFRVGLRHISNANLIDPNAGINNFIMSAGFFVNLRDKEKQENK